MKNKYFILILLVIFSSVFFGQVNKKQSLLVSNCEPTEGICDTQHLYRYDFINGEYAGKEKILSTQFIEINIDMGDMIYRDRYLITDSADIIDIVAKKVIHQGEGDFLRIEDDKIFNLVNYADKQGLYVYDLKTNEYTLFKKLDDGMFFGTLSPNGLRNAHWECQLGKKENCGFKITEFGHKTEFIKANFSTMLDYSMDYAYGMKVPIYWLDDDQFLTQKRNGDLVTVSCKGKITLLLKIKIDRLPKSNPSFHLSKDGVLIYQCGDDYEIDVAGKSYKAVGNSIGNGFSVKEDDSVKSIFGFGSGKIFFQNNAEIGRNWSINPVTKKDYLAVVYGENGSKNLGLGSAKGIKVWNSISKSWTTIEIKWDPQIIGWMEK